MEAVRKHVDIARERDKLKADAVIVVHDVSTRNGVAYQAPTSPEYAFAVVDIFAAQGNQS